MTDSLGGTENAWAHDAAPRMLNREQARMEQHLYWSTRTVEERLHAMTELTRRMCRMRGIDRDERKTDFSPSRVSRRRS